MTPGGLSPLAGHPGVRLLVDAADAFRARQILEAIPEMDEELPPPV